MKPSFKLLFSITALTLLSVASFAAQEMKKPGYKPKDSQSSATEGTTILIFKVPTPENNEDGTLKKAGRAERTTSIPNINRLKADTRKTLLISMNA